MNHRSSMIELPKRWLFVCALNLYNSSTAEHVARSMGVVFADSCGTENGAVRPFNLAKVMRADIIVCFGRDQETELKAYGELLAGKTIICWDDLSPAQYAKYCDPELMRICKERISEIMDKYTPSKVA